MAKGHSKKRNSGLLYNFLLRKISAFLVEGDEKKANRALKILKTAFRPGTELHKELRLINSLAKVTLSNASTASSVIQEAKVASRTHDVNALDREKSLLIRNINHRLNDDNLFYEQYVPDYKILATIQTLVNEWRQPTGDIEKVALYEDALTNHLITEKTPVSDGGLVESSVMDSRLIVKAMTKRLNERYNGVLSTHQKELIRMYALSSGANPNLRTKLAEIRANLLHEIDVYVDKHSQGDSKGILEVKEKVINERIEEPNDELISRFMAYSGLLDEFRKKEERDE